MTMEPSDIISLIIENNEINLNGISAKDKKQKCIKVYAHCTEVE